MPTETSAQNLEQDRRRILDGALPTHEAMYGHPQSFRDPLAIDPQRVEPLQGTNPAIICGGVDG